MYGLASIAIVLLVLVLVGKPSATAVPAAHVQPLSAAQPLSHVSPLATRPDPVCIIQTTKDHGRVVVKVP